MKIRTKSQHVLVQVPQDKPKNYSLLPKHSPFQKVGGDEANVTETSQDLGEISGLGTPREACCTAHLNYSPAPRTLAHPISPPPKEHSLLTASASHSCPTTTASIREIGFAVLTTYRYKEIEQFLQRISQINDITLKKYLFA